MKNKIKFFILVLICSCTPDESVQVNCQDYELGHIESDNQTIIFEDPGNATTTPPTTQYIPSVWNNSTVAEYKVNFQSSLLQIGVSMIHFRVADLALGTYDFLEFSDSNWGNQALNGGRGIAKVFVTVAFPGAGGWDCQSGSITITEPSTGVRHVCYDMTVKSDDTGELFEFSGSFRIL